MRRKDPYQDRARELCVAAGIDPDSRVGQGRGRPAWCDYRDAARAEHVSREQAALAATTKQNPDAPAPIVVGQHDENTIGQMKNCMSYGNVAAGVICADGHLGYAQPVGGVIAYRDQISVSGVGFDIACGNMAVKLDTKFEQIKDSVGTIIADIGRTISFGLGRANNERVDHALFESDLWERSERTDYKQKAQAQLGTVGSGNHYVDLMHDEEGHVWIGVHFGSRGLGHSTATKYLKLAGGKDGMNVPPAILGVNSDLGRAYLAGMELGGLYAYAGREWVVERVRRIVGGSVLDSVHNHHNFAWREQHGGQTYWVVRKGATPAFPGQRGFVGGSMGDDAVIIEGVESTESAAMLYSTIHGAGRLFGRKEAKRRFQRAEMDDWLRTRGVMLVGADLDESPMAYRRLPDVLTEQAHTIKLQHTLRPFAVAMAGSGEFDPFKD
jgi:tRNA-splicing ligase RtcB (3'-phosphate/5'-hydroxy nucleic acid ligase)